MQNPTKGFVIVASKNRNFYVYATNLAESIRDFYPDANITLFTEDRFLDGREDVFDNVMPCGSNYREKLYGMAETPYDITMYVDADMDCEHEDIIKVWDELKDYDMVFHELTKEREKFYAIREFEYDGGMEMYTLCGGVCLYRSYNPLVREFMHEWNELFIKQYDNVWRPKGFNEEQWDRDLKHFDQTTLWWLINKEPKYKDLKIGIFEDDIRWNYFTQYAYGFDGEMKSKSGKPPILRHFSATLKKDVPIV